MQIYPVGVSHKVTLRGGSLQFRGGDLAPARRVTLGGSLAGHMRGRLERVTFAANADFIHQCNGPSHVLAALDSSHVLVKSIRASLAPLEWAVLTR